jgi:hypothetical protein
MVPGVPADAHAPRPGAARRLLPRIGLVLALLPGVAERAGADWLLVPHTGLKFGGGTTLVDLETAAPEKKTPLGFSVMWVGTGIVGVEGDVTFIPDYFDREKADLVTGSSVRTVTGGLVLTTPLRLTRESLRPYLVGGVGLLRAQSEDLIDVFSFESYLLGLHVGGGAIGFLSDAFGVRFDLRYYRNLTSEDTAGVVVGDTTRLTFWRASLGLVFRY